MPNKTGSEVLRDACPFTLGDEPLASGVEDGAVQLRMEVAQVGIPLDLRPKFLPRSVESLV